MPSKKTPAAVVPPKPIEEAPEGDAGDDSDEPTGRDKKPIFTEEPRLFLYSFLMEYRQGDKDARKELMKKKVLGKFLCKWYPKIIGNEKKWMKRVRAGNTIRRNADRFTDRAGLVSQQLSDQKLENQVLEPQYIFPPSHHGGKEYGVSYSMPKLAEQWCRRRYWDLATCGNNCNQQLIRRGTYRTYENKRVLGQ